MALTVSAVTTTEVQIKPALKRKLLTELKAFAELKSQLDAIEGAMAMHKATIGRIQEETGEVSLAIEGFKISLVSPTRSTLDKKLLLLNGVSMGQIENSTVTKATKPYVKVTVPGAVEEQF
jgi:hypothetical protein